MIKTNVFFDFTDFQAKFGPPVPDTPGIVGHVILASPTSACEPLTNDDGCVCFQYLCVLLTRPDEMIIPCSSIHKPHPTHNAHERYQT